MSSSETAGVSFPYRFGAHLKAFAHIFDVREVRCKGGIVEGEVPLPGGTALMRQQKTFKGCRHCPHHDTTATIAPLMKEKLRNCSFNEGQAEEL